MPPRFIYFDLGNVVLRFSHERMCAQMAAVAGVSAEKIWDALFRQDLKARLEAGKISSADCYEALCKQLGVRPDRAALEEAGNDIFDLNPSILPLIVGLETTGHRIGILSNICENHWNWVSDGRFGVLPGAFEVFALSYQIGAIKPDPKIYRAAAELAGVTPQEIFFTDDMPGHVAAAREAGYDAVQYSTTAALATEMRKRGIRSNY